jgi:excisionase family DNA binding protein
MADDRWLSVDDVAGYLGVKRYTVYRWIDKRGLPAHKRGKLWLFSKDEVDRWVRLGGDVSLAADSSVFLSVRARTDEAPLFLRRQVEPPESRPRGLLLSQGASVAVAESAEVPEDREHPGERSGLAVERPVPVLSTPAQVADIPAAARVQVGVVMGLAAGVDMPVRIEALTMTGRGEVIPTGAVGRVMSESVAAAVAYVRAHRSEFGFAAASVELTDVVVVAEIGDIPIQSDTLGAAVTVGLVSALTGVPLRRCTAIAGRVNTDGRLLPVGDVPHRLHAAARGGIREVFLPTENADEAKAQPFLQDWPMKIVPVGYVGEVLQLASTRGQLDIFKMVGDQNPGADTPARRAGD